MQVSYGEVININAFIVGRMSYVKQKTYVRLVTHTGIFFKTQDIIKLTKIDLGNL